MKKTKRLIALLLCLVMTTMCLAGCGGSASSSQAQGGNDGAGTGTTTTPNTDVSDTLSGAEGASDKSVVVATKIDTLNLSPLRTTGDNVHMECLLMYERPMYLSEEGQYVKWLMKDYTADPDGVNYDFEIYDYIYDSEGNHITAEDIVFDIEQNIEAQLKPDFSKVESVEATGDYTVHIKLKEERIYLFESLMWSLPVFSKAAFEASPDGMNTQPVSTSPYKVTSFVGSSTLVYERRDDHWQTDPSLIPDGMEPNVKTVTFNTITEASQRVIAVETGKADVALYVDAALVEPYMNDDKYLCETVPGKEGNTLFFSGDAHSPVADDLYLRQAIAYAIDAAGFVQALTYGYGTTMNDCVSRTAMGYDPDWDKEEYYPYDVDKAKELLAQSNYKGQELHFVTCSFYQRFGELLMSYCQAAGINVVMDIVDYALGVEYRHDGSKWDLFAWAYASPSLAYNWSLVLDGDAYTNGDAMSRKDRVLTDLIHETCTPAGYTKENIQKVHEYVMDNMYIYGIYLDCNFTIYRKDSGLSNIKHIDFGNPAIWACSFLA